MSVIMLNKNVPNNNVNETGTSCEGLLPGSLGMRGQVPGGQNLATTNKTPLNAANEGNVMVLREEEWEDIFGNSMEITRFNGFSCESSNEDDININSNNKETQTGTKTLNTAIMECYFFTMPIDKEGKPIKVYRRRMHNSSKEQYGTEITEQHLCDYARAIGKNEWIAKLELESTSRKVLQDIEVNNNDKTGERFYQDEKNIYENEASQVDTENLGEEKTMMQDILDLMKDNSRIELQGFNKIDRCIFAKWSRNIYCILKHTRTKNITDTKILIKAVIVYVEKKVCLKAFGSKNKKELEPCWKRRIKKMINNIRKHINILECHQRGKIRWK